jgi:hypothetical protein
MTETKVKPKAKFNCKITLAILGQEWTQEGRGIEGALSKFDLSWEQIKGKGEMRIELLGKKHTHLFSMVKLRRIFSNKIVKSFWAKNLNLIIEGK